MKERDFFSRLTKDLIKDNKDDLKLGVMNLEVEIVARDNGDDGHQIAIKAGGGMQQWVHGMVRDVKGDETINELKTNISKAIGDINRAIDKAIKNLPEEVEKGLVSNAVLLGITSGEVDVFSVDMEKAVSDAIPFTAKMRKWAEMEAAGNYPGMKSKEGPYD